MATSLLAFLNSISSTVFRIAAVCFVLVNGAAIVAFALTRSRRLIDAWTPKVVTIDAVLLGTGLGVPLLVGLTKLGVRALGGVAGGMLGLFK